MTTAYTTFLGLALPVTGELSGTWGDTVNDYITQYLDASVAGTQTISGSQTAVTLSKTTNSALAQAGSGATGSAQYNIINCTGNPAGTLTVTISYPTLTNAQFSKSYLVINSTSTSQSVVVQATTSSGTSTGTTLVSGEKALIAWNGSDFIKVATSTVDGVSTIAFGTTGLTPSTATSGAVTVAGTLVAANGGTGQSSYTTGDLLYATGSTALSKLGIGASGNYLSSSGTAPQWSAPAALTKTDDTNVTLTLGGSASTALLNAASLTLGWTGQLSVARGGTNATATPTAGAVAYGTGTAYAFTAAGTSNQVLISNGSSAPSWSSLSSLGVTSLSFGTTGLTPSTATQGAITVAGTLATTNGGTGLTSFTANGVVYASSSSALTTGSALTWNGSTLLVGGNTRFGSGAVIPGFATASDASLANNASLRGTNAAGSTAFELIKLNTSDQVVINNDGADAVLTVATTSQRWIIGGEQMRLTSTSLYTASGINVGIGTSSPSHRLVVQQSNTTAYAASSGSLVEPAGGANTQITNTGTGGFASLRFAALDGSYAQGYLAFANSGGSVAGYFALGQRTGASSYAEQLRLDSSGNLGLGVTPSAWGTAGSARSIQVFLAALSFRGAGNTDSALTHGAYYNGTNWIYQDTNVGAARYQMTGANGGSTHSWSVAAGGTAGNTISFTQAMTLDASGFLGIGQTSPISYLDIYGNGAYTYARFYRSDEAGYGGRVGTGNTLLGAAVARSLGLDGYAGISFGIAGSQVATIDSSGNLGIGTSSPGAKLDVVAGTGAQFISTFRTGDGTAANNAGGGFYGVSSATAGSRQAIMWLDADGANFGGGDYFYINKIGNNGNVELIQNSNAALTFQTSAVERARITSGGYAKFSNDGTYTYTASMHEFRQNAADYVLTLTNSNASPTGLQIYQITDANGTGNNFVDCYAGNTYRFQVRSNGGIANYSANDVNLSDRREKTNFAPAKSYLDTICAIPVQTFNYIDQSEDDPGLTLGVVAQDVQAVAPELVMESNWGTAEDPKMRLSIYQTDLQYALMKCIQELKAELDTVKAELATLKGN